MARKILLADDSVTAQNMGRKILTDAGYEVSTVNNGSAALKRILEQRPDLIVLDVYMPGYSGLEVCQRIKENRETSRIPILLTVGKLEPFKPEEARRARADAFVVKPFEASELLAALSKLEDKIVPQAEPYKPGRFAKAVAAVEADAQANEDTAWKSRLRIPSGKKSEPEPEVDYAATQGKGFRELRVEETGKKPRAKAKESEDTFERPMPAGLPADITPEEIAAITAAAARLHGTPPAAGAKQSRGQSVPADAVAPASSAEESAPVTFASTPDPQTPEAQSEMANAVEADMSVAPVEPVVEPRGGDVEIEASTGVQATKPLSAPVEIAPAPLEVAAPGPVPAETHPPAGPRQEPQTVTAALVERPATTESSAQENVSAPASVQEASVVAASAASMASAAPPADDEVMAALQSLMPRPDASSSSAQAGSNGSGRGHEITSALAALTAQLDSKTMKAHVAGPRWIAEEVAFSAGEASLSLQREMEGAYAAIAAEASLRASSADSVAVSPTESVARVAETPAATASQPDPAEATIRAMASAAGAGDIAPVTASAQIVAQETVVETMSSPEAEAAALGDSSATPDARLRITEVESPAVASAAAPAVAPDAQISEPETQEPKIPESQIPETPIPEVQMAQGADEMANWKNIRDSIAGAAPRRAPSKEEIAEIERATAEVAVPGAPAHEAAPSTSASDAKAIASIVDSVLAELRPKIVEEIAKKLATDPKKD